MTISFAGRLGPKRSDNYAYNTVVSKRDSHFIGEGSGHGLHEISALLP
jgi:hypothetical protein